MFAQALATRLDPRLGRRQHYTYGTETRVGSLNELRGILTPETVETARPRSRVQVTSETEPGWTYPTILLDHTWTSNPRKRTYPGQTLLLGDSFMWYALENLRPIFHKGRFLWFPHTPDPDIIAAIKKADTVVIANYQAFLPTTPMFMPAFRGKLRRALN